MLDIENYISASDIGIYTSEEESFGMGILETLSYGKPVLATRAGGIPEFMSNGKTGFLFKIGDTDSMAQKLIEISKNPELVTSLGENAKKIAQTQFTAEAKVQEYVEYYRAVIARGK